MDDELKKIKKYNRRIWILLSLLVILVMFGIVLAYFHDKPQIVNNYTSQQGKAGESIIGPQGISGYSPIKGVDYFDGAKGETGSHGIQGEQGIQGDQGVKGDKGDIGEVGPQGRIGRTAFSRVNQETGQSECRYAGDEAWQPESECQ